MSNVIIYTDSSAGLPQNLVDQYAIQVQPLKIHWDDQDYTDGVDLTPAEFYQRLDKSKTLPVSSQGSLPEYELFFKNALERGDSVLTLPISSGISGSFSNAMVARQKFPKDAPIEVFDSKLVSMPLGLMVLAAARAAQQGASLAECRQVAEAAYPNIGVYFMVDTLKYLALGGRIGGAKRLIGSALNLKPILELRDGKIDLVESVMSRRKALDRMMELLERNLHGAGQVRMTVFHAAAPEVAADVTQRLQKAFSPIEIIPAEISPIVGLHVGSGTLSVGWHIEENHKGS